METATETTIKAQGWEMGFVSGVSDKFYRVMFVQHGGAAVVLANYGRRGSTGQFKSYLSARVNDGLRKAQELTDEKVRKGYEVTHDFTEFEVSEDDARALVTPGPAPSDAQQRAARAFTTASRVAR